MVNRVNEVGTNGYAYSAEDRKVQNQTPGQFPNSVTGGGPVNNQGIGVTLEQVQNPFLDRQEVTADDLKDIVGRKYADNLAEDINEANSQIGLKYAQIQRNLTRLMRAIGNPNDERYVAAQSYLYDLSNIMPKDFNFSKGTIGKKEANYKDAKAQVTRDLNQKMQLLDAILQDSMYVQLVKSTQNINANTRAIGAAVIANDDKNAEDAAIHREIIAESMGDEIGDVKDTVKQEGARTRQTVRNEHIKTRINDDINSITTREQVRASERNVRRAIDKAKGEIKDHVTDEAHLVRINDDQNAEEIKQVNKYLSEIDLNMNGSVHLQEATNGVNSLKDLILNANVPFYKKDLALQELVRFTSEQTYISKHDLKKIEKQIRNILDDKRF